MKKVNYSDKSFIVYGTDTKKFKDNLKELGGKFNGKLKAVEDFEGGAGWIFQKINTRKLMN